MENGERIGLRKNLVKLLLVAFAGSIIYGLPYFRLYYYDAYLDAYNLTNTQMGALGSAYGVLGLISYFIGGVLADKFPAKKLIIISLLATGIGGFAHLIFTGYVQLVIIYAIWGITSLLLFWPSLLKVIRTLGTEKEQGRAYGIFEGGRGVTNAVHMAIATAIFGAFQAKTLPSVGLRWIIIFYSVMPIICGLIFIFILKDPEHEEVKAEKDVLTLAGLKKIIKIPAVWLMVIITFTTYTFNMSFYYFTPYATNVIGTSAVFAAVLTVLAQYVRPVASTGSGFLADKIGKSPLLILGFILMGLSTLLIILAPNLSSSIRIGVMVVACTVLYLAMYSNYGIFLSIQDEGKIPLNEAGKAIGIIATLGYLPEVISPLVAGKTLDAYEGVRGYHIYFGYMILMAIIGVITCLVWYKMYGKSAISEAKLKKQATTN